MNKRVILAGVLGGLAMFLWSSIAHMVLPLGRAGISEIPNEQTLLGSMHSALGTSPGLYFFPGMGSDPDMQHYEQKLAASPSGILIYHPPGGKALTPGQLATEFLTELSEALLLAWLIAQTRFESFIAKASFSAVAGLLAVLPTNMSYWNWYGFPSSYTFVYMFVEFMGFIVAGLVASSLLRPMTVNSFVLQKNAGVST